MRHHGRTEIAARRRIRGLRAGRACSLSARDRRLPADRRSDRPPRRAGLCLGRLDRRRDRAQGPHRRHEALARDRLARAGALRRAHPGDARPAARARRRAPSRAASRSPSTRSSASTRRSASSARAIPTWMRCARRCASCTSRPAAPCRPSPRRSRRAWSSSPSGPSATGCRTRPERYRDVLGDDGLAALDTILTRKLDAMPADSRARALAHGPDAARDERVAGPRARRHRPPRARARARPRDAGALRAHRARAGRRARREDDASTGCSAAWPRTARATTRCATRSWRPICAPTAARTRSRCCATSCPGAERAGRRPSCWAPPARSATASATGRTRSSRRPPSATAMPASSSRRCSPTAPRRRR